MKKVILVLLGVLLAGISICRADDVTTTATTDPESVVLLKDWLSYPGVNAEGTSFLSFGGRVGLGVTSKVFTMARDLVVVRAGYVGFPSSLPLPVVSASIAFDRVAKSINKSYEYGGVDPELGGYYAHDFTSNENDFGILAVVISLKF